jgi:hypothetical protein
LQPLELPPEVLGLPLHVTGPGPTSAVTIASAPELLPLMTPELLPEPPPELLPLASPPPSPPAWITWPPHAKATQEVSASKARKTGPTVSLMMRPNVAPAFTRA